MFVSCREIVEKTYDMSQREGGGEKHDFVEKYTPLPLEEPCNGHKSTRTKKTYKMQNVIISKDKKTQK